MNLDFTKPRPKAQEMAAEMGIDLTDEVVIKEFKRMQSDRLKEVKAIKEGKKRELTTKTPEADREDYNDVFRESNRAAIDNRTTEEESKQEPEIQPSFLRNNANREIPESRRMEKEEEDDEDSSFNPVKIVIGAVVLLWISSLLYLLMFRG